MYTNKEVFPRLNAQLRFAKRDIFFQSAQFISIKLCNSLVKLQEKDSNLLFMGTCYRGTTLPQK